MWWWIGMMRSHYLWGGRTTLVRKSHGVLGVEGANALLGLHVFLDLSLRAS
jgi:hypothetical protein